MRIWHPKVHELFNERLHYYLLTVRPYDVQEFKRKLIKFKEDKSIGGLYYYEVFGAFDIILRVWLPAQEQDRFFQELIKQIPEIDRHFPFRVTDIGAYWCREQQMASFKEEALDQVTVDHIREIQSNTNSLTGGKFGELGLLTSMAPSKDIKVFIFLSNSQPIPRAAEESFRNTLMQILKKFKTGGTNIERESVYYGFGFAWALIKAETPPGNYFLIGNLVDELIKELRPFGFFTNTYLAAADVHLQSDDISPESLIRAEGSDLLSARLLPDLYKQDLNPDLRKKIIAWIQAHRDIESLPITYKSLITRCLAGVIAGNERIVLSTLQEFFVDQERYLRPLWPRILQQILPRITQAEIFQAAGIPREAQPKFLALGQIYSIYAQIYIKGGDPNQSQLLGRGWETLAKLRNLVAHGACDALTDWPEMLDLLVKNFNKVDALKNAIESALSQPNASPEHSSTVDNDSPTNQEAKE
jgi:hypothetical protein